jgi:hypothetical protein
MSPVSALVIGCVVSALVAWRITHAVLIEMRIRAAKRRVAEIINGAPTTTDEEEEAWANFR